MAQDAIVSVRKGGERDIAMADFPMGYDTVLDLDEMVTDIRVPVWPEGRSTLSSTCRHGDYAITSSAVLLDVAEAVEDYENRCNGWRCRAVAAACTVEGLAGKTVRRIFSPRSRKMPWRSMRWKMYTQRGIIGTHGLTRRALAKAYSRAVNERR